MHKSWWPKALILFGAALAFILYEAKDSLRQDWDDIIETASIHAGNLLYTLNPERAKPVSTLKIEEDLKASVGEPFLSFKRSDWNDFWDIVYGVFSVDYPDNERLPPRARQLTYPEMEARLKKLYPTPLNYFQDPHWQQFWQVIFGKKAKKR